MQTLLDRRNASTFLIVSAFALCACDEAATSVSSKPLPPDPAKPTQLAADPNCQRPYFYNFLNSGGTIVCLNLPDA